MEKKLLPVLLIFTLTGFAQIQPCGNIGFEDGTHNGWTCGSGTFGSSTAKCEDILPIVLNYGTCHNGQVNDTNTPLSSTDNRHTIMSNTTAKDPNSNNTVPVVAPASMFPTNTNKYSFRIGNALGTDGSKLALSESIKFPITVTAQNAGLTYMYAAFVKEASGSLHPINQAPRFEIKITEKKNGGDSLVSCGYYQVIAGAAVDFLPGATDKQGQWKYTNWTKIALDLTGYIGKQITIEFRTTDCYPGDTDFLDPTKCSWRPGSHSAYAYIDMYCTPIQIISPPVCANQASVQLCAPAGYATYQWPSGQPGIVPPLNKQCVTVNNPKAGDKYIVNMTSVAGGCPTSTTIVLSGADFTLRDTAICIGAPPFPLKVNPTTVGNYTFNWAPATNLSCTNCQTPTFTPGSTTTYTVTMVDKNVANCNQVKTMTVNVGTSFTVKTTNAEICEGETATITATGADTYSWQPGNLTGGTQTVSPVNTVTYTVTGVSASATCPGNATAISVVTVNKKPVVTVTDVTICSGESATLTGIINGGGSAGTWIGGSGTFTPNRLTLNATYKPTSAEEAAGKVTLTLESEDPVGPCLKDSKTMTITIVPGVKADAGPDKVICYGSPVQLDAKSAGGTWSGGMGIFSDKNNPKSTYIPSAAEAAAGKVTLSYSVVNNGNATCPGGTDEMIVTIEKLSVSAGADQTICFGEAATLAGSIGGEATVGTWSGGAGIFNLNNTTLTATYTPTPAEMAAGTVILVLTTDASEACPAKKDTMLISINPLAVVDAGPHQAICFPGTVTLAGTVSGGAISGSWSGGTGIFSPNSNSPGATYTPSAAEAKVGKALLTFTTNDPPGPCPAVLDTMSITIYEKPIADAGRSISICTGNLIVLDGKITGGAVSGTWTGGLGKYDKSNTDLKASYTPTPAEIAAGKITFTLTSAANGLCSANVATVTHFIHPNPVINFAVDTPKACPPHCVDFTDSTKVMGANIIKWEWDFGNTTTGSDKNPKEICYPQSGSYTVGLKATSDKGCVSSLVKPYMIETYPQPTAQFTAEPNPVSLYDPTVHFYDLSSADVTSWVWNLGDGKIVAPSTKNPIHKYLVGLSKIYMVTLTVTNSYGCKDSIPHPIEVQPEFTFFIPNAFTPGNSEQVNDTFFGKGVGIIDYHLWVFDRWGNMIFNTKDINTGWDGRANNGADIAQQDVYVWKVKLKDVFNRNHEYIGTVTLVR